MHPIPQNPIAPEAVAQPAPRIPQISPNPNEPILLTPAPIVLSLAPANYCNKAR